MKLVVKDPSENRKRRQLLPTPATWKESKADNYNNNKELKIFRQTNIL